MKRKSAQSLLASLAMFTTTVLAAQPSYLQVSPALTEHLNVRAEPSVDSKDIGDIKPGAQPFELLEIDASGQWGRIIWQETTAWVAMRFMEPIQLPKLADTIVPIGLLCAGTEPFWTIEFESAENAVFNTMEAATPMSLVNIAVSENKVEYPVAIELLTANYSAVTVLNRQACSDGLTDINYSWTADLVIQPDLNLLSGCCIMR